MVPDGLWNAPFWGSMLAGAALRGCQVLVIGISPEKSASFLVSRSQEVFSRLILFRQELQQALEAAGGILKIGIYDRKSPLGDVIGAHQEMTAGFQANPFLKEIFPFPPEFYTEFENLVEEAKATGFTPVYYAEDAKPRKPKLHLKINFLMSQEVQRLLTLPDWGKLFRGYFQYRERFIVQKDEYVDVKDIPEKLRHSINQLLLTFWLSLSPQEQASLMAYVTVGSHNHNYRSMIMDGEAACLVQGEGSLIVLLDMFDIAGLSTWVDDLESLEPLLPAYSGFSQWLGRYLMKAL